MSKRLRTICYNNFRFYIFKRTGRDKSLKTNLKRIRNKCGFGSLMIVLVVVLFNLPHTQNASLRQWTHYYKCWSSLGDKHQYPGYLIYNFCTTKVQVIPHNYATLAHQLNSFFMFSNSKSCVSYVKWLLVQNVDFRVFLH